MTIGKPGVAAMAVGIGLGVFCWFGWTETSASAESAVESPGVGSKTAQDTADERLESEVERRLRMEGRIRWESLRVEADRGLVTLYGIVKSQEERGFAEKAASTVEGVAAVSNKILVQPALPPTTDPSAKIEEDTRDRVIEGPGDLKDRQLLP